MTRSRRSPWPHELRSVFFDDVASRSTLRAAVVRGEIRKVAPGIFTSDLAAPLDEIVIAQRFRILAHLIPDALVADRSAARDGEVTGDRIFVASLQRSTNLELPGLTVVVRPGAPISEPIPDPPWSAGLWITSPARTLVDNLAPSKGRSVVARTLSIAELEEWVARKLLIWDAERVERLRVDAELVAEALGVPDAQLALGRIFASVRNSGPVHRGATPLTRALRAGAAWDTKRVEAFETLAAELATEPPGCWKEPTYLEPTSDIRELGFWEAYFSNYIEGTEFTIDQAREIVDTNSVPSERPEDGHDILGTYACVVDPVGRAESSEDPARLMSMMVARHESILEGRPEKRPGKLKDRDNQAGTYQFVNHQLVEGTLYQGLGMAKRVPEGFRRALFLMFVITETHPFTDGNGRLARIMANAELSAYQQSRIVIPIVFRNEYLSGLRALSRHGHTDTYVKVMAQAWRWTAAMPWHDRASCEGKMEETHALVDSTDAADRGIQLMLP
jgi:hypothetical protein